MNYLNNLFTENGFNSSLLKQEKWLQYLCITKNFSANIERVDKISEITGRETLNYVLKTLEILEDELENKRIDKTLYELVKKVLQWSEVSKGGTKTQRDIWREKGLPLDIHNLASAEIYREQSTDSFKDTKVIYTLIKTHGYIGQFLRGEVSIETNRPLLELKHFFTKKDLINILMVLNKCIIGGVSMELWERLEGRIYTVITNLVDGKLEELNDRLKKLYAKEVSLSVSETTFFDDNIFPFFELWYFNIALSCFTIPQIINILNRVLKEKDINKVQHLNFKRLAETLHYDYEGKRHVNVYKKRVIEKYLEDDSIENVDLVVEIVNGAAYVDFKFSPVCSKLIDFCVEAERSNLLTYEKSITVLFDMFGFRKDEFDRLNNEDKYLDTMNASENSTKNSIIEYVEGDTIVDVGSGGGVLLDLLEERYPNKKIIGTDISTNVIEKLVDKKVKEVRGWTVQKHNFVDEKMNLTTNCASIIFSSILHEIFSYAETEGRKFNIESVNKALKNAYDSLPIGGRIIIRDGIKTDSFQTVTLKFKDKAGIMFFNNFLNDFKGLPELGGIEKVSYIDLETLTVKGNINFMREFLYTYTWGNESYAHEVNEQFGYFTLNEYKSFFENLGAKIIIAKEFLEPGYSEHLLPLVSIFDENGTEMELPNSNCIIVIEKQ